VGGGGGAFPGGGGGMLEVGGGGGGLPANCCKSALIPAPLNPGGAARPGGAPMAC
jgi:hypothetical protein